MFGLSHSGSWRQVRQRRLRVEGLETRWMLAGDTGEAVEAADLAVGALTADWPGFLITDLNGNVMVADVEGTGQADLLASVPLSLYDIAISPSGRVLGVDATSVLYELNVNFNNPGGSLDPVQIGIVTTNNTGVQLNGLEFTADGTLLATGFDSPSSPQANYLYSLNPNSGFATRLVNLGSHQSAGDVTADEDGNVYVTTLDGDLLKIPPDYSGYSVVGNVGFVDLYGLTYGPGPDLRGYRPNGNVIDINTVDASWVSEITLFAGPSVHAPNSLLGASTIFDPPTNLGSVGFMELTGQSPILETLWYRFDTLHDGFVTAELDDLSTTTGLETTLYRQDTDGNLNTITTGTTRVDYDSALAGDRYFVEITGLQSDATVRVCNQVEPGTDTLTIYDSDESDAVEVAVGTPYLVTVNGIDYEIPFAGGTFVTTTFAGGDESDSIRVVGGDGDDTAEIDLATRSGTMTGLDFEADVSSTDKIEFDGGDGHDTASIQGTDADGQLNLSPFQGELVEGTVSGNALNTEEITIDADGGNDHVDFEGDSGADRLDLTPTSGMYHENVPEGEVRDPVYSITATNIESNFARSGGGLDAVSMRDSEGDETFVAGLGLVTYEGPGYSQEIRGFHTVLAYGLNGGFDRATIYDTDGNDKFKGREELGLLRGGGFYFRAKGFESIESTALYGGTDVAVFDDTSGNDTFTASYESATMTGSGLTRTANGFAEVIARASVGYDIARLEDSPGRDVFRGRENKSTFLSLDDNALDVTVRAFDEVHAESIYGSNDIAKMHDTSGDNLVTGTGNTAEMYIDNGGILDLLYEVMGFDTVKVYWTTGTNTKDITPPIDYTFIEVFL